MARSPEIRSALRSAYIYEKQSLEAAAQRLRVSKGTASRWKREALEGGDDWNAARTASMLSSQGSASVTQMVLEQFVLLFQSTLTSLSDDKNVSPLSKAEAISRLSDAYNKTMSAAAKGNPKLNKLAVAMEVITLLANFIREQYPELTEPFSEMLGAFGETLTEKFN